MPAIPAPRIQTPADEFQKSFFEKEIEEKKEPETAPVQAQSEEEKAERDSLPHICVGKASQ